MSLTQNKGKRKRSSLPDTRVVGDLEAYKLSKAEAAAAKVGTPTSVSTELSPAKSTKKKSKSSENEGALTRN